MAVRDLLTVMVIYCCFAVAAWAVDKNDKNDDEVVKSLLQLSLLDLIDVEIISAGKKPQSLNEIPAAVFVVTQDDIQRSGATTLPDVLRLVPGMFVAQLNSHAWAVSARGFNEYFAAKMLVMVDGRSVYVREFSGVWWDQLNLVLEDIERIEVIRGPGGTLWGANAVNGIINIITKDAKDTQGGLVSVTMGNQTEYDTSVRYGAPWGDAGHFRVYAKTRRSQTPDAELSDAARNTQVGFRFDTALSDNDDLTIQGDYYRGRSEEIDFSVYAAEPEDQIYHGGNILGRWTHRFSDDNELQFQNYFDSYRRNVNFFNTRTQTFDIDLQQRFRPLKQHEILWGLSWRYYEHRAANTPNFTVTPDDYSEDLFSFFVQDEFTLQPEHWFLTFGVKFEHTELTNWETQPSLRLLWMPNEQRSLWAAVSWAVRMPDWARTRGNFKAFYPDKFNVYPFPVYLHLLSTKNLESERLMAYELGWRETLSEQFLFDATLFTHEYDKLAVGVAGQAEFSDEGVGSLASYQNQEAWNSYGAEFSFNWQTTHNLQLQATYTYLNNLYPEGFTLLDPKHQITLGTHWQFAPDWQLNVWLRRNSKVLGNPDLLDANEVDAYVEMDMRLAWQPKDNLTFSVVGRNLLADEHYEPRWIVTNQLYLPVQRSFYAQVQWQF